MGLLNGYKTYTGVLLVIIPVIAKALGYDIGEKFSTEAPQAIDDIIVLVGSLIALYGRLVAQTKGWFAPRDDQQ